MTLYTVKEVAEMLKVTENTIRTYINSNMLQAKRFGDPERYSYRITEKDLEEFINNTN